MNFSNALEAFNQGRIVRRPNGLVLDGVRRTIAWPNSRRHRNLNAEDWKAADWDRVDDKQQQTEETP